METPENIDPVSRALFEECCQEIYRTGCSFRSVYLKLQAQPRYYAQQARIGWWHLQHPIRVYRIISARSMLRKLYHFKASNTDPLIRAIERELAIIEFGTAPIDLDFRSRIRMEACEKNIDMRLVSRAFHSLAISWKESHITRRPSPALWHLACKVVSNLAGAFAILAAIYGTKFAFDPNCLRCTLEGLSIIGIHMLFFSWAFHQFGPVWKESDTLLTSMGLSS